jgi:hypothetical protein
MVLIQNERNWDCSPCMYWKYLMCRNLQGSANLTGKVTEFRWKMHGVNLPVPTVCRLFLQFRKCMYDVTNLNALAVMFFPRLGVCKYKIVMCILCHENMNTQLSWQLLSLAEKCIEHSVCLGFRSIVFKTFLCAQISWSNALQACRDACRSN